MQEHFDYRAAFIGPQGENADEVERLVLEVLRDHIMWRRNFHPEDPRLIAEWSRSERPFRETTSKLRDSLYAVLARLKRGAPLHSHRQLAHMVTDPSLPSLVGYFAGLLYNQNNVVQEASPETVRCEREFIGALAQMVGFPPLIGQHAAPLEVGEHSFGHLTSGGTSANMEVLWTVRNVRFFPLALRLLLKEAPEFASIGLGDLEIARKDGESGELGRASATDLFALPVDEIVRLKRNTGLLLKEADYEVAAAFRSQLPTVRRVGLAELRERYQAAFPSDSFPTPVVLISRAAHYCWQKAMDLTGLGSTNLRHVAVDRHVRMDPAALLGALETASGDNTPVLMTVSICGTTETTSVDPLVAVNQLRDDPDLPAFWHHTDGAFGAYFASMLDRTGHPLETDHPSHAVSGYVREQLRAIGACDSVVLDPHKMGFMPYPAGALLFREYSVRDAIAYDAPYLAGEAEAGFGGFLGRWTLEGSRPGAAAVAGYLAQKVVPLEPSGHGQLLGNCVRAHRVLFDLLVKRSGESGVTFLPFGGAPDLTGTCFVLVPPHVSHLSQLN
ncbi:MAG: tyrosine decarboxylase, partial [Rhodothermales bacterium]|nr:tyrosine decarboxylase [Rhodothermales bacterium]